MEAKRCWFIILLTGQAALFTGCTTALWDQNTFARYYRPAHPNNVALFYCNERKDILVQYDESRDNDKNIRTRCYWLDPNTEQINRERKPHFISSAKSKDLISLAVTESPPQLPPSGPLSLYGVAGRDDDFFTLYLGNERLDPYSLPKYKGSSQTVKQICLTPFAVAVDITIVGAIISYYAAPQILPSLNR